MNTGSERRRSRAAREGEVAPLVPIPEVVWHDLECGSAATDLPVWEELAEQSKGLILEFGCGTGRVGLHLARAGHTVVGVDRDAALVGAFNERAALEELDAQAVVGDVRKLSLRRAFGLVIAPMQMIQQIGDTTERLEVLHAAAEHLQKGGKAAFAIVEDGAWEPGTPSYADSMPDIREIHDWVFSSTPQGVKRAGRGVVVERFRESVSPQGERFEEHHSDHLDGLDADRLEAEAALAQLHPVERREISPDPGHAPSVVVVLEGKR